mmetsp:Transcript_29285/g.100985  ORF Transcript_29285/g.100985 Transcript_29285/m.100985 type:complete len:1151 (+) Transcript_29285:141-3593(+)
MLQRAQKPSHTQASHVARRVWLLPPRSVAGGRVAPLGAGPLWCSPLVELWRVARWRAEVHGLGALLAVDGIREAVAVERRRLPRVAVEEQAAALAEAVLSRGLFVDGALEASLCHAETLQGIESAALSLVSTAHSLRGRLSAALAAFSQPSSPDFATDFELLKKSANFKHLQRSILDSLQSAVAEARPTDAQQDDFDAVAKQVHFSTSAAVAAARKKADAALDALGDEIRLRSTAGRALWQGLFLEIADPDYLRDQDGAGGNSAFASTTYHAAALTLDRGAGVAWAKAAAATYIHAELALLPNEIADALKLKSNLLQAGQNRALGVEVVATELMQKAKAAKDEAVQWAAWYSSVPRFFGDASALCARASLEVEYFLASEDARTDARSEVEKLTRRALFRGEASPRPPPLRRLFSLESGSWVEADDAPLSDGAPLLRSTAASRAVDLAQRRVRRLDVEFAQKKTAAARAVAEAARVAWTTAPEVALKHRLVLNTAKRFALFGDDECESGAARLKPRCLGDYDELAHSRGALRGLDRLTGEKVVLKAYNFKGGSELDAELASLLALPRHEAVAAPRCSVQGDWAPVGNKAVVYFEFAAPATNLQGWLQAEPRAPWHIQSVARQLLAALLVLHAQGLVHGHVDPTAVVLLDDKRAQLALKYVLPDLNGPFLAEPGEWRAPEQERGQLTFKTDMFAFGSVLRWMHKSTKHAADVFQKGGRKTLHRELQQFLDALLHADAEKRPSAADALLSPYFQNTYIDRYIAGGDIVGCNEKLDAVRSLLRNVRAAERSHRMSLTVRRGPDLMRDVFSFFRSAKARRTKAWTRRPLKVTFAGEDGVDEGGLTVEMFALFFAAALNSALFEDAGGAVVLPAKAPADEAERAQFLQDHEAFGRAIITAAYELCAIPTKLAPSLFKFLAHGKAHAPAGDGRALRDLTQFDAQLGASLEKMLATAGDDWGLDFAEFEEESVQNQGEAATPRRVSEANKAQFVALKVRRTLVGCRLEALEAIRRGFEASLAELSPEAAPFLKLFSATDWRVLLCGAGDALTAAAVLHHLKFAGFPKRSVVPAAVRSAVEQFPTDSLRRFLVFATGAPALPARRKGFEIVVRAAPASNALPVAHTCFAHVDVPDVADASVCVAKLQMAIYECGSFDRV